MNARLVAWTYLWLAALPWPALAQDTNASLREVQRDLEALRIEQAQARLSKLEAKVAPTPELLFEQGQLAFYQGDYAQAVQLTDQAIANARSEEHRHRYKQARELLESTQKVTANLRTERSPNGRYQVSYSPGKDAVLVPYAMAVLKAADQAITARLGLQVPSPIRLEIYPSASTLAQVSALTVEQIETTGTIALSKWNRLMITTPRALVRGYPWADTITHEFVHMVLSRITSDHAPVWMQEGTAKMLERSFRGNQAALRVDPASEAMLAEAKSQKRLLTFEQMHPSIAMLPSQEDAALAFAEVSTFMQRYVSRYGDAALRDALSKIAQGTDAQKALATAASTSFATLESDWRASLPTTSSEPAPRHLALRLKEGSGKPDETLDVAQVSARRFLRLGDLLWDQDRPLAASSEYAKAAHEAPDDPIIGARLARAALSAGKPERALKAVERLAARYPEHAPSQAMLGAARLAVHDRAGAATALREAIYINPFDPQPHCDLAQASDDREEQARELAACRALRHSP